jgi:hypothetical protein
MHLEKERFGNHRDVARVLHIEHDERAAVALEGREVCGFRLHPFHHSGQGFREASILDGGICRLGRHLDAQ